MIPEQGCKHVQMQYHHLNRPSQTERLPFERMAPTIWCQGLSQVGFSNALVMIRLWWLYTERSWWQRSRFLSFSSFRSFIWSETHALSSHQSKIRSKFAFYLLIVISVENFHLTPLGCNLVTFHAERNRSLYERGRRLQNVGLDFFSKVTWPSLC